MSKKISIVLVFLFLVVTMITPLIASAAAPVAKSVTLKSDNGEVKVRSGDDIKYLYDGDKLFSADGKADFNQKGIVLIQNTKADTRNHYPVCTLIIDLGGEKDIDTVDVTFYHYYNAIIDTPKDGKITVSYSIDGQSFSEIKTHTMSKKAASGTAGIIDEKISLGKIVKAKAVMVAMTYGNYPVTKPVNEWFGFTEISAGLAADYNKAESAASSVASSQTSSAVASMPAETSQVASSRADTTSPEISRAVTSSEPHVTSGPAVSRTSSPAATADDDEGMDTWTIAAIVVVAVAAIGGVIYYLVRRSKNV